MKSKVEIATLKEVREWFNHLGKYHENDFYSRYGHRAISNKSRWGVDAKVRLLTDCRKIFDYTTKRLKERRFSKDHEYGQKRCVHLVSAHISMTIDARKKSSAQGDEIPKANLIEWYSQQGFGVKDKRGPNISPSRMEIAKSYVMSFSEKDQAAQRGIGNYLRNKGVSISDKEISDEEAEAAWWLLMLRGIVWAMSTRQVDKNMFGEFIPSSFYGNKTPVWVT